MPMPTAQIARVRAIPICVHYCAIDHIRTMSQTYCGANTCRGQHTPHLWYAPAPEHCSGAPKKLLSDYFLMNKYSACSVLSTECRAASQILTECCISIIGNFQ